MVSRVITLSTCGVCDVGGEAHWNGKIHTIRFLSQVSLRMLDLRDSDGFLPGKDGVSAEGGVGDGAAVCRADPDGALKNRMAGFIVLHRGCNVAQYR
jgi:hypothetical protein